MAPGTVTVNPTPPQPTSDTTKAPAKVVATDAGAVPSKPPVASPASAGATTTGSKTLPTLEPPGVKSLRAGESLAVNQKLLSPNGKYWLILRPNSSLDFCTAAGIVWSADVSDFAHAPKPSTVDLRPTGELVVLNKDQQEIWSNEVRGKAAQDTVLLAQDDGHLAILSNGERVWYTELQKDAAFSKDRLVAGEWLSTNQALVSPSGKARLVLEQAGDFVLYRGTQKLWSVKAVTHQPTAGAKVYLQEDDNICIGWKGAYPWDWTSGTRRRKNGGNAILRVADADDGGTAVLEADGFVLWSTKNFLISNWDPRNLVQADRGSDRVRSGQYLSLKQSIYSPNGVWAATVREDGIYIEEVETSKPRGASFKPNPAKPITRLWLGWDGNLVLGGLDPPKVWESKTSNFTDETALVIQDDGKLVLQGLQSGAWTLTPK